MNHRHPGFRNPATNPRKNTRRKGYTVRKHTGSCNGLHPKTNFLAVKEHPMQIQSAPIRIVRAVWVVLCPLLLACLGSVIAGRDVDKATIPQSKQEQTDDGTIAALIAQLGDDNFEKREDAGKRLLEIGEPGLALLEMAAEDPADPEIRYRAKNLVGAINNSLFVEVRRFEGKFGTRGQWANRVMVTRDGCFVVATSHAALRCWEIATGKEAQAFDWLCKGGFSWSLSLSHDDRYVLTGSEDRVARMLDFKTGKVVQQFVGHTGNIWGVALLPGGKQVISGALDQSLRVWDVKTGKETRAFHDVRDDVRGFAVSPDGKTIAASHLIDENGPGTLRLWDLATGKETRAMKGHTFPISSVSYSPDGKTLLTSGFDKLLRLWDAASGKELKVLKGHVGRVEFAAFTQDGKRIVSCGDQDDMTLRLWDVASGTQLLQSAPVGSGFTSVAVVPDSRQCVTTGKDGFVRLWEWKK